MNFEYNDQQKDAIHRMIDFCSPSNGDVMFMLEGSAGTGKTTCVQEVVAAHQDKRFVLTAPTNKATKVLREMGERKGTEGVKYSTIYSLLGLRVTKDEFVRVEPLGESAVNEYDVVIVDEASMVNKNLMNFITEASVHTSAKFLFMGDPLQLPPVGEADSDTFSIAKKAKLTKVMRHDNQILTFATSLRDCILNSTMPEFRSDNDENGGVYTVDYKRMQNQIRKAYTSESYFVDPNSCKTVAWRNAAVNDYNQFIRQALYEDKANESFVLDERVVATHPIPCFQNPQQFDMTTDEEGNVVELEVKQHPMFEEFKVYHLKVETEFNDAWADCFVVHPESYRAYNDTLGDLASAAKARRGTWGAFWALKNEYMHDVRPCHAITAHRSQGSTYRNVFVDVQDILSNRNRREALRCLYVAASRASNVLVLRTR